LAEHQPVALMYVSKFPGQLVRSLPTKPSLWMGTAVAVSRGDRKRDGIVCCDVY